MQPEIFHGRMSLYYVSFAYTSSVDHIITLLLDALMMVEVAEWRGQKRMLNS